MRRSRAVPGVSGGPGGEAELTLGSGAPPSGAAAGKDGPAREAGPQRRQSRYSSCGERAGP